MHERNATLTALVKPASKRPGIARAADGSIEVRVSAPAIEGKANAAARRALAVALGVPQRNVTLVRGASSRRKVFAIEGLSEAAVQLRLAHVI